MGYGARARRVPARGNGTLTDVDIYKIGVLGKPERGFENLMLDGIYSWGDYLKRCGSYGDGSESTPYVVRSFFEELDPNTPVELKVLGYVASDAVQATYSILDQDGTPEALWTATAGRKGVDDVSAFGNKIGIQITSVNDFTMKLTANTAATPTTALLDSVDGLEVGMYLQFTDGSNTEVEVITAIDNVTKQVTFAAMVETYTAALTTVSRVDIDMRIGLRNYAGNYDEVERWIEPLALSATVGIEAKINDAVTGSDYLIFNFNGSNATADAADQIPAVLTAWTPLASGSDGTGATADNYNTLLTTYFTDTDITFLLAPEFTTTAHHISMAAWATSNYKCMYYGQAPDESGEAALKNFGNLCRKGITFSIIPSDKWLQMTDPVDGNTVNFPKVGVDAAHWFNTYTKFGESKVAAGNKPEMVLATPHTLVDSNGLVHNDEEGVGDRLIRDNSINICRFRQGIGITNNSARTLSTDGGYKFQNQIMQFLLYKKSILSYLQTIEQDRAGTKNLNIHKSMVASYMRNKFRAGHIFQGTTDTGKQTTFEDACIIINDFSINSLANIANGIEEIFVQFIAPPPIEEPILSLASASVTVISG